MAKRRPFSRTKRQSSGRRPGGSNALVRNAINSGRAQAAAVLGFRQAQLKHRERAMKKVEVQGPRSAAKAFSIPRQSLRALGSPNSAGLLIAEGDSWFDYPFHDVLRFLEDDHAFEIESVAHRGDRVEDMAYSDGQLEEFARRLEKMLRNNKVPKAILLSGGGNDIAGDEFSILLNHAKSPIAGLNDDIVNGVVHQRILAAYTRIISAISAVCERYLQRRVPIIVHGYDYVVPDGRGFMGGFWLLPGPWLKPGFEQKGFFDTDANIQIMKSLMNTFNDMLRSAVGIPAFSHVTYLDLRRTLPVDATYKKYWANELHPTERGFGMVAEKFATVVNGL